MGDTRDDLYKVKADSRTVETLGFNQFLNTNRVAVTSLLFGLFLLGGGILLYRLGYVGDSEKVEILGSSDVQTSETADSKEIVVEISGAVFSPGVYKLKSGDRVENLIIAGGGLAADSDREWIARFINKAAKLSDGQKLYIPKVGESSEYAWDKQSNFSTANNSGGIKLDQGVLGTDSGVKVNINTASLTELDSLPGIGQVYGQSIIDHRPYSDISELVTRGAIKQNIYDKLKEKITVY